MSLRFNPPPGWPTPPPAWQPPAGWRPDPSWDPLPPGWVLWIDDPAEDTTPPRSFRSTFLGWTGLALLFLLGTTSGGFPGGLVMLGIAAAVVGVLALFRGHLRWARIPDRTAGAIVVAAALASVLVGGAQLPPLAGTVAVTAEPAARTVPASSPAAAPPTEPAAEMPLAPAPTSPAPTPVTSVATGVPSVAATPSPVVVPSTPDRSPRSASARAPHVPARVPASHSAAARTSRATATRTVTVWKSATPRPSAHPIPTRTPRPTATASPASRGVHPGAFCAPEGALGRTVKGTLMRCTSKNGDRPRWRAVH